MQPHASTPDYLLCDDCVRDDLGELCELEEVSLNEPDECCICGNSVSKGYNLVEIEVSEEIASELSVAICECDLDGCGRLNDNVDKEEIWNTTNYQLNELLWDYASAQAADEQAGTYSKLIAKVVGDGHWEALLGSPSNITCSGCGRTFESWWDDVTLEKFKLMRSTPKLPNEVTGIPAMKPPQQIEYYRSDCSRFMVHLTRASHMGESFSNVTDEVRSRLFSAPEVLWLILAEQRLRAAAGSGMRAPAVCFTEKPLAAIKDTLLGRESDIRRRQAVLTWSPYGIMFEKDYLRSLGVSPVVFGEDPPNGIEPGMFVPLGDKSYWIHEREWRIPKDLRFDREEAIVLVPNFEQVKVFGVTLEKHDLKVKGILPLYELFGWC
jgi:hypothetical protein